MNNMLPHRHSRRRLLCNAGAIATWAGAIRLPLQLSLAGLLLSRAGSCAAVEPITTGLAVASAVAGLLGSQNQGDGGLSAMLKATLDYQRALSKQLLAVQEGIALIVRKLDTMESNIQAMLHQGRLKALQGDIGAQILRYEHEVNVRASTFTDYSAWLRNRETQQTLADISNRLEAAVTRVQQERWFDALTALHVCTAAFAGVGVRAARGEQVPQLMAEAQRYLDIFTLFENAAEADTLAFDNAHARERIAAREKEVTDLLGIPSLPAAGSQTLLALGEMSVMDSTPFPPMTDDCVPKNRECRQRFYHAFDLRSFLTATYQTERNAQGGTVEILQYSIAPAQAVPVAKDGKLIPQQISVRGRAAADFQNAANASAFLKAAQDKADSYRAVIDNLNIAIGKAALDANTLIALSATRQRMFRHFGKGA